MPTKVGLLQQVVNQMMKGPRTGRVGADKATIEAFYRRHEDKIHWVMARIPKHYSAAVGAVLTKALIVYGVERVAKFCDALTNMKFRGPNDPVHLLWLYLLRPQGKENVTEVYRKMVTAVRAYMDDKSLERLTPARGDIFSWDEGFTIPDAFLDNNDRVEAEIREPPPAQVAALTLL